MVAMDAALRTIWKPLSAERPLVPAPVGRPRLVIWGDSNAADTTAVVLAWEVPISNVNAQGQGPIGRYYVDAAAGTVLEFRTDKHECGMPGCSVAMVLEPVNDSGAYFLLVVL